MPSIRQKVFKNFYPIGGSGHDIWTIVVSHSHPSLLKSLTRVNKFTNKIIYEKYPLEKWIDWVVRDSWKRIPFSYTNIRNEFSGMFEEWSKVMNSTIKSCFVQYLVYHLLDITSLEFLPTLTEDERNTLKCPFFINSNRDKIYFKGHDHFRLHNDTLNLENCIVIDKTVPYSRSSFCLKTHRYMNGKPVYLRISTQCICYVNITEYFDKVL